LYIKEEKERDEKIVIGLISDRFKEDEMKEYLTNQILSIPHFMTTLSSFLGLYSLSNIQPSLFINHIPSIFTTHHSLISDSQLL
jgi:hypothetical protein